MDDGVAGSAARGGRAIGAMFLSGFGTVWMVWWCLERVGVAVPLLLLIVLVGGLLLTLAIRQYRANRAALAAEAGTPESKRMQRAFNLVNNGQWIAITVAALVLANTGHAAWIRVAIIFVVGAHFLPLAAVYRYRWHYLTGAVLMLVAAVYPLATPQGPLNPIGLLLTGLTLWASTLNRVRPRGAP